MRFVLEDVAGDIDLKVVKQKKKDSSTERMRAVLRVLLTEILSNNQTLDK